MKSFYSHGKLLTVLAGLASALACPSAFGFTLTKDHSIALGFRQNLATYNVVVEIGDYTNYTQAKPGVTFSIPTPQDALSNAFSSFDDLYWSAFGTIRSSGQPLPQNSLFLTKARSDLDTQAASTFDPDSTDYVSAGIGGITTYTPSRCDFTGTNWGEIKATATYGSYSKKVTKNGNWGASGFECENYTPDDFVESELYVRSDFYEVQNWGSVIYLGYFQFNNDGTMTFTAAPAAAPTIAGLTNETVTVGATASFAATVTGSPMLQWQFNGTNLVDGSDAFGGTISGSVEATLDIANVQLPHSGAYTLIASNAGGVVSNSVTLTVQQANTAPILAALADTNINVGCNLNITNAASDSDVPAQTLTFSVAAGPTNATINADTGVFAWRPLVSQADSTNLVTIQATDSGTPPLSASQSFLVVVNPLTRPHISASGVAIGGKFGFTINGETGPDYAVQTSTNLTDWQTVFSVNSPATPYQWTDTDETTNACLFYRVVVGPPLP